MLSIIFLFIMYVVFPAFVLSLLYLIIIWRRSKLNPNDNYSKDLMLGLVSTAISGGIVLLFGAFVIWLRNAQ